MQRLLQEGQIEAGQHAWRRAWMRRRDKDRPFRGRSCIARYGIMISARICTFAYRCRVTGPKKREIAPNTEGGVIRFDGKVVGVLIFTCTAL
jgi:hypothetical protein